MYAGILKKRTESEVEENIIKTQFGFRTGQSTKYPLFIVRRIQDRAEASGEDLTMIFIVWEKAFDRVKQDKLIEAMAEAGVSK